MLSHDILAPPLQYIFCWDALLSFLGKNNQCMSTYYAPELKQQTLTLDIFGFLVIKNYEKSFTTMFIMNWLFHYCVRTILSITIKMVNHAIHFRPKFGLYLNELGMCIFFLKLSFHQRLCLTMNYNVQWGKLNLLVVCVCGQGNPGRTTAFYPKLAHNTTNGRYKLWGQKSTSK